MIMTRKQAEQNLVAIGIAEPTAEQITNYLNQVNGETQAIRDKSSEYQKDSEKAKELQAKLDEIEAQGLSDLEKANKRIAELEKSALKSAQREKLANIGITGENAEKLIGEDGSLDFDLLGTIITEREKKSASDKEAEILKGTLNPGGNKGDKGTEKTEAEKVAEEVGKRFTSQSKSSEDILGKYI